MCFDNGPPFEWTIALNFNKSLSLLFTNQMEKWLNEW